MVTPRQVVLALELLIGLTVLAAWWWRLRSGGAETRRINMAGLAIGLVAGALDTLGLDGMATAAVAYRTFGLVDAERIPGTLQVGFVLPALVQALLLTTTLVTQFNSLLVMVIAAALGARLGSGVATRLPARAVGIGLGLALLGAGTVMFVLAAQGWPVGGSELALHGTPLLVTLGAYFVIGGISAFGAGSYAPCMMVAAHHGMNPAAAMPIVRAAGLSVTATAARQFIRRDRYDHGAAIGLALGATLGVVAAMPMLGARTTFLQWPLATAIVITGARTIWALRLRPGRVRVV
jgi:uncharacterized membrane protein YfcA